VQVCTAEINPAQDDLARGPAPYRFEAARLGVPDRSCAGGTEQPLSDRGCNKEAGVASWATPASPEIVAHSSAGDELLERQVTKVGGDKKEVRPRR